MWKKSRELAKSFKRELAVYRRVFADARTPVSAKAFLGLALGYLCMPFDLIPDFIPVLGQLDDAFIVPALVYAAVRLIPQELVAEHRANVLADYARNKLDIHMSEYHEDSHAGHSCAPASFNNAFAIGVALNAGYVVFDAIFGLLGHSLALVADAGHNLSDVLGLLLAWGASAMAKTLPTKRKTYGLLGTSILAALFNAIFLLVSVGAIAWEALRRFNNPIDVAARTVIWVSLLGIAINTVTALMFMSGRKGDPQHPWRFSAHGGGRRDLGRSRWCRTRHSIHRPALDRPGRQSLDLRPDYLGHNGPTARIGEPRAARCPERCRS